MVKGSLARRYAQAVFLIAKEKGDYDAWQRDLDAIAQLGADAAVLRFMEDPRVSFEEKTKLLEQALAGRSALALNLVRLLVTRGRLALAGETAAQFRRLVNELRGVEQAEVTTAVPLDEDERQTLEQGLARLLGKHIVLKPSVDPAVVGGFVARIDGKLLDGSTRGRLQRLKQTIAGGEAV